MVQTDSLRFWCLTLEISGCACERWWSKDVNAGQWFKCSQIDCRSSQQTTDSKSSSSKSNQLNTMMKVTSIIFSHTFTFSWNTGWASAFHVGHPQPFQSSAMAPLIRLINILIGCVLFLTITSGLKDEHVILHTCASVTCLCTCVHLSYISCLCVYVFVCVCVCVCLTV